MKQRLSRLAVNPATHFYGGLLMLAIAAAAIDWRLGLAVAGVIIMRDAATPPQERAK